MTVDLGTSADAQARGWGAGWPHDNRPNVISVTWNNGVQPIGGMHRSIALLVTLLGNETIRRGYEPHKGWCWGYDNRPIAGTQVPSNHSWGLAVDINAPTNPYTRPLHTDMPPWMPSLWGIYGFRWGGHYSGPFDAMHYEFMGTPSQAAERTAVAVENLTHSKPPVPAPVLPSEVRVFLFETTLPGHPAAWFLSDGGSWYRRVTQDERAAFIARGVHAIPVPANLANMADKSAW